MTEHHVQMLEASEAQAAKRSESLDKLRGWLDNAHKKGLEAAPYGHFQSRIPVATLAKLSPAERSELDAHERGAFDKYQPLAQAQEQQRTAFVAAGGAAEDFDAIWELGGKDAHAAQVAEENLERARQTDNVF